MIITRLSTLAGAVLVSAAGLAMALVPVEPIWNLDNFADVDGGSGTNTAERLHQLYEQYNERFLRLNPIVATFRGDHRYNAEWSNSLYEGYQRESRSLVADSF